MGEHGGDPREGTPRCPGGVWGPRDAGAAPSPALSPRGCGPVLPPRGHRRGEHGATGWGWSGGPGSLGIPGKGRPGGGSPPPGPPDAAQHGAASTPLLSGQCPWARPRPGHRGVGVRAVPGVGLGDRRGGRSPGEALHPFSPSAAGRVPPALCPRPPGLPPPRRSGGMRVALGGGPEPAPRALVRPPRPRPQSQPADTAAPGATAWFTHPQGAWGSVFPSTAGAGAGAGPGPGPP